MILKISAERIDFLISKLKQLEIYIWKNIIVLYNITQKSMKCG